LNGKLEIPMDGKVLDPIQDADKGQDWNKREEQDHIWRAHSLNGHEQEHMQGGIQQS
jgi:hypothetical protein